MMANYAHLNNADNTVIAIVDWDGVSEVPLPPGYQIDSTLLPLEGTAVPPVGAVWNGTVFEPPAEEPPPEIPLKDRSGRLEEGGSKRKHRDD